MKMDKYFFIGLVYNLTLGVIAIVAAINDDWLICAIIGMMWIFAAVVSIVAMRLVDLQAETSINLLEIFIDHSNEIKKLHNKAEKLRKTIEDAGILRPTSK